MAVFRNLIRDENDAVLLASVQNRPAAPNKVHTPLWTILLWVIAMLVFAGAATAGITTFIAAPSISGIADASKPAGYGPWDVVGLAAWLYLAPYVAVFCFALSMSMRPRAVKLLWIVAAALICLSLAMVAAKFLAQDVLSCGVVFCYDISSPGSSNTGAPFYNSIGLGLVVLFGGFSLAFIALCIYHRARSAPEGNPNGNREEVEARRKPLKPLQARLRVRRLKRVSAAIFLAVVVLPLCLILTAILPNSFSAFQSHSISTYMASETVFDSPSAAELPRAFMRTVNWRWSDSIVLKLFPDTLLFYGFLETLALAAVASAAHPPLACFFAKSAKYGITVGEFLSAALLTLVLMAWMVYWMHDHKYDGGQAAVDHIWSERTARTCGMTAVLFMSLCLLPASKNSLWLRALGISWESSVWLHRWLGGLSILWAIAHVLSFWVRFSQLGILLHDILSIPPFYPLNGQKPTIPAGDDWTIPLMELIGYPAFFLIGLPHFWRKKNWELFKYLHFVFLALVPATLLHAASAWYFFLGGVAFYLVDVALRFVGAALPCKLHSSTAHEAEGGVTELWFDKSFSEPGQYCFVNVPAISAWEWHPFSLCSSPLDGAAQMCIKNMGKGTFTGRLWELSKENAGNRPPPVINVDGPYGPPLDPRDHAAIMLLAGGIGITPMHSTFRALSQLASLEQLPSTLKHVRLVWIGRSIGLFSILAESVAECISGAKPPSAPSFHAIFYLDNPGNSECASNASTELKVPFENGRPNISELMDDLLADCHAGSTALVQCCGPPPMANAVEKIALTKARVTYESQLFAL